MMYLVGCKTPLHSGQNTGLHIVRSGTGLRWEEHGKRLIPMNTITKMGAFFNKYRKGFMLIWGKDTRGNSVKMRHIRKVAKDKMCPLPLSINNLGQCIFIPAQSLPPLGKWLYPYSWPLMTSSVWVGFHD